MEPALLPALVLGCHRLILIGDQNQLPPVVVNPACLDRGLGVSLFARLAAAGMMPALLNEQYRMHPKIAEFSSRQFYSNLVTSKVKPIDRPLPIGVAWPKSEIPVLFIDVSHSRVAGGNGKGFERIYSSTSASYLNEAEVNEVVEILNGFLNDIDIKAENIGIISPYSAQVYYFLTL